MLEVVQEVHALLQCPRFLELHIEANFLSTTVSDLCPMPCSYFLQYGFELCIAERQLCVIFKEGIAGILISHSNRLGLSDLG